MTLGSMNHLGITVSDLTVSTQRFYAPLLDFLGYREVERQPEMSLWLAPAGYAVNLWQATRRLSATRRASTTSPSMPTAASGSTAATTCCGARALRCSTRRPTTTTCRATTRYSSPIPTA